jgi:hypothetical protein
MGFIEVLDAMGFIEVLDSSSGFPIVLGKMSSR